MSSKGNRSNPNETRMSGHHDGEGGKAHGNATGSPDIGRNGGAAHQESRDHNKHNNPGQSGHKPQEHSPEQEKR
jgi:hypothetical protein